MVRDKTVRLNAHIALCIAHALGSGNTDQAFFIQRSGKLMKHRLIGLLAASFLAVPGFSQVQKPSNWRVFRAIDGLPSPVCSSVTLGAQGKVVLTHPDIPGITELDGY